MNRRQFISTALAACTAPLAACARFDASGQDDGRIAAQKKFEITKSDGEWKQILSRERYYVLRRRDTEPAGSSPLNHEHRTGTYRCAGCDLPLFLSRDKFDSGTGWPSFTTPLEANVRTSVDQSLLGIRIEVHCRRCGGHLGHVFDDGPPPTGKRYCINGLALTFRPGP